VLFALDRLEATSLLAPHGVEPLLITPSRCLLALAWFDYATSDIGPYREVSVSVPARANGSGPQSSWLGWLLGRRDMGAWVLHLPVTSQTAFDGGRECFGFPKSVQEISFGCTQQEFLGSVGPESAPQVRLRCALPSGPPVPIGNLPLLSALDGRPIRSVVTTRGSARWRALPEVEVQLGDPSDPMVRTLARRGPALACLWSSSFEAKLLAPQPLAQAPVASQANARTIDRS
jgi:hypothetical protein